MIMEPVESKVFSVNGQAWDPGEPMVQMKSEGSLMENNLLLREASLFLLFRPSTEGVRPTCITEGIFLLRVH